MSSPTPFTTMHCRVSPGRNFCGHGKSGCCLPSATTNPRMPLKETLRMIPFTVGRADGLEETLRRDESRPTVIGPVTFFIIKFEKLMFSKRDLAPQRILIGQPNV